VFSSKTLHYFAMKRPLGHGAAREHEPERAMPYRNFRKLLNDESGATTIEYGLIAILVSLAVFLSLGVLGDALAESFSVVSNLTNQAAGTVVADNTRVAASLR